MRPFMKHWKELDIRFDAVYSGFLGSFEQLDIVKEFFSLFKREDNLILVDPVMGDNGELYKIFTPKFAKGMRSLCEKADIIVPNLTEAALLLGEPYQAGPYTKAYIDGILHKLSQLGPKQVVLTGVYFDEKELGAATFDMERNATEYVLTEKIPGYYHGTGDVSVPCVSLQLSWMIGLQPIGLSHSEISGSKVICTYPKLIAAYHVLHRLREPRHPPYALSYFLYDCICYQITDSE